MPVAASSSQTPATEPLFGFVVRRIWCDATASMTHAPNERLAADAVIGVVYQPFGLPARRRVNRRQDRREDRRTTAASNKLI